MIIPFYVYKIKLCHTDQFYFGSRYRHVKFNRFPIDDLWINYKTSSYVIKDLILKYGDSAFTHEIIFESYDRIETFLYEQNIIKINIKNPLCLNKSYRDSTKNIFLYEWTDEQRFISARAMSDRQKESWKTNTARREKLNNHNESQRIPENIEKHSNLIKEQWKTSPNRKIIQGQKISNSWTESRKFEQSARASRMNAHRKLNPEKYNSDKNNTRGTSVSKSWTLERRQIQAIRCKNLGKQRINKCKNPPIQCIETNQIFKTQRMAATVLNIRSEGICLVLSGKRKTVSGYSFRYVKEI